MEKNINLLTSHIELCKRESIVPIAVIFPFSRYLHDNYPSEKLTMFKLILSHFINTTDLKLINMWDKVLDYSFFTDASHLNLQGAALCSQTINEYIEQL